MVTDQSGFGPPLDPIAPLRIALRGHYDIERELGQGAFATVYLARDLKHERKVAIKVLHADPTSETGEMRFIREIRLLARLQHPNILPLHDSGHVEALLYYVMPYVAGETLRDRINRERQLALDSACNITRDVADALAYAHGQGIIHRDIKPENILLSAGHPVLADFGIARVIDVAGVRQLTRTGMGSPGTPAYMSPEQLMGDKELDGRSDTYSLGCVLFEMLTGKPPFSGKDGFVKRFTELPPRIRSFRSDAPEWMEAVVATALARSPSDRFQAAQEIVNALSNGGKPGGNSPRSKPAVAERDTRRTSARARRSPFSASDSPANRPSIVPPSAFALPLAIQEVTPKPPEGVSRRRRRLLLGGAITLAAVGILAAAFTLQRNDWRLVGSGAAIDSTRIVILPFATFDARGQNLAREASDALYQAFRGWEGLNVVTDLQVSEALSRGTPAPSTLSEAMTLARRMGAGRLVWGHMVSFGNTVRPRAELYDLARPEGSTREVTIQTELGPAAYAGAAIQLLAPADRPVVAAGGDGLTRSYSAWQAYNRGHLALKTWDLAKALVEFELAVDADSRFPVARLWLGQILEWKVPLNPELWREHAERAAAGSPEMLERDRLLAIALAAMGRKQFPAACDAYQSLTRIDSLDFIGWYGLGECRRLDRVVLPDASSPSGWRFRSSYDAAVKAYAHALRLEPGAHALLSFETLRRLLPTAATNPRTDNPANPAFAAYPSLAGDDTLAFVPYPVAVFAKGLPVSATSSLNRALDHNLDALFEIASRWVRVAPQNPDAFEALADVLESRGDIVGGRGPTGSATSAVRQAVLLSSDPQQRLRLAVREGILRFRRGDYVGTNNLADSLFASGGALDTNSPPVLISLAALTGRVEMMARLANTGVLPARFDGISIPSQVTTVAARLFATSALGVCGDTLTALRQRLEQRIESSIADAQRAAARAELMTRSLSLMVPCTAGISALDIRPSANKLQRLQQAFARKDSAGVRVGLRVVADTRRPLRPTDWSIDYIYQEAWIRAAMGDSVAAMRELDRTLNSIASLSSPGLREPAASAAVGRAMALRADLASRAGDPSTARRWARAVTELWANADPPLQSTVLRMKAVAAPGL